MARTPWFIILCPISAMAFVNKLDSDNPLRGDNMAAAYETRIGELVFTHEFADGYPTDETAARLYDERDFQRACQAT